MALFFRLSTSVLFNFCLILLGCTDPIAKLQGAAKIESLKIQCDKTTLAAGDFSTCMAMGAPQT